MVSSRAPKPGFDSIMALLFPLHRKQEMRAVALKGRRKAGSLEIFAAPRLERASVDYITHAIGRRMCFGKWAEVERKE